MQSLVRGIVPRTREHSPTSHALVMRSLKHFEQSLAYAWPASHSQIYPELARLLEAGLIEQAETGPRGSKTYALTDDGLAEIRRWLRETKPDRRGRSEGRVGPALPHADVLELLDAYGRLAR